MTDVPFPMLTVPGQAPQVAGGRLINCYPETLPKTAGKPYAYWRVPGLSVWGTTPSGLYRGGVVAGGTFYAVFGSSVYTFTQAGGAGTQVTGSIPGSSFCWCAANQNNPPDVVIVSPGVGTFVVTASGVQAYPDANVNNWGAPNCVVFLFGMLIFTVASGTTFVSNQNSTTINTLNYATAQSKPDALYRPVSLGNGQLLLVGASTMEVWGGSNPTGYPFSYIQTIFRGVPGPQAIAGDEDGWGKGIYFVGDDNKVSTLTTYTPTPVSVPDLDQLIEAEPDKTKITVGVYVSRGHGFVVVQGPAWCWEYDTTLLSWHERRSYLQRYWRAIQPKNVFNNWLCGDVKGPTLFKIDGTVRVEGGVNEVQSLVTTGTPTGGTFTLTFGGQLTSAIAYNATAAQVLTALSAITTLSGNVSCAGGPLPAAVTVTFTNQLAKSPQALLALSKNNLTGGAGPTATITRSTAGVAPDPLGIRIETGLMGGAFPRVVRVNEIEVYMTKGASIATGHDPDETNAMVAISMSRDGGQTWTSPRNVTVGRQSITTGRARSSIWGQADIQGVRWRFDESAGLNFAFMGADMNAAPLR